MKTTYESLKTAYDLAVSKDETLKRLAAGTIKTAKLPTRPNKPTLPSKYNGLYLNTDWTVAPTEDKQIVIDSSYGGWGSVTMGLLTPAVSAEKSFGILGFGQTTTSPAYDAGEQSFVSTPS